MNVMTSNVVEVGLAQVGNDVLVMNDDLLSLIISLRVMMDRLRGIIVSLTS